MLTGPRFLGLLVGCTALFTAGAAGASPWTLPKDDMLVSLNYDFQFAEDEFLPDGTHQSFPLNGQFTSSTLRVGARYGFTSKLELSAEFNVKAVQYTADPVILGLPEEQVDLAQARASVTDFSANRLGPADLWLTGRYNLWKRAVALASETRVKVPTGYKAPQATFDQETGAVADDVALGDGQTDLEQSLLFGFFVPQSRTFGRVDAGFRLRFGGPGHQAIGGAKVGQFIGEHVILFAGTNGAYTVNDGNVLGSTFIATVDDLQPQDVAVGENVVPVDLRLDKDWLAVEAGLLLIPAPGVEIQAGYSQVLVGSNIPAIKTVTIGTALRFQGVTAEDE